MSRINKVKVDNVIYDIEDAEARDLINSLQTDFDDIKIPTKLSELENDSGYVTNTDYASSDNVGLVKTEKFYGLHTSSKNGTLYCEQFSYDEYTNDKDGNCFVSKGTLENVLEAKDYATQEYVDEKIENIEISGGVDLTDYATKEYVNEQISNIEASGGSSLDNYSTEEQVIGTWFGKPLYRKVVITTTHSKANTDTEIGYFPEIQEIIKIEGFWRTGSDISGHNLYINTYYNSNDHVDIFFHKDNHKLYAIGGQNYLNKTLYLTIEYTKLED